MKKTTFLAFIILILFNSINAQVLYSEDFDSYTIGNLGTDITGTIAGKGNWYAKYESLNSSSTTENDNYRIVYEKGRGKILLIESEIIEERGVGYKSSRSAIQDIGSFWSTRDVKNNILKIEFEFNYFLYSYDNLDQITGYIADSNIGTPMHGFHTGSVYNNEIIEIYYGSSTSLPTALFAQHNTWQKIIIYVDYDNYQLYFEYPSKNYATKSKRQMNIDNPLDYVLIRFLLNSTDNFYGQSFFKVDNIKISAVNTLPTLNIIDLDSLKFNLFPNPVRYIVNITNSENIFVNQVKIYDLSGKLINTQNFNNEAEIQLNVENLTSGIYMLHLQTDQGIAIKKLIKK